MSAPDNDAPVEIVWQGKYITTKKQGRWEYVARSRGIRAAAILAVDEENQSMTFAGDIEHGALVQLMRELLPKRRGWQSQPCLFLRTPPGGCR